MAKTNSNKMQAALKSLSELALRHEAILVGYSGGKDSRVLVDLCKGAGFKRVVGFSLLFLPDQPYQKRLALEGKKLHDIEMLIHTGGVSLSLMKDWAFCSPSIAVDRAKRINFDEITAAIRVMTGIELVALGEKNADYMFRAHHIRQREKKFGYVMPIKEWSKADVISYLKYRKIPLPDMGHSVSGAAVDLTSEAILWMYDCSREDYEHVQKYFPEIEAVVYRRELYGIGKRFNQGQEAVRNDARGSADAPGDSQASQPANQAL